MMCETCLKDKPDVMRRSDLPKRGDLGPTPALCVECCAYYPGREWMRGKE